MKKVLRFKEVIEITGLSRATIYNKMKENSFPQSIKLGANSVGWFDTDINEWFQTLGEAREQQGAAQ